MFHHTRVIRVLVKNIKMKFFLIKNDLKPLKNKYNISKTFK